MISLEKYKSMDPYILLSAVNMQLRDEYSDLDDLCKANNIDENELKEKLKQSGFEYNEAVRQFK